jgi:hypothetical protein
MNIKAFIRLVGVALLSFAFVGNVAAKKPCRADIQKFCADHKGDRAKVMNCLLDHQNDLSDQCKSRVDKKLRKPKNKKGAKKLYRACETDIQEHCQEAGKNKGKVLKCLKDNKKDLEPQCKTKIRKLRRKMRRRQARRACKEDVKAHCSEIKPGQGRIKACLKSNMDKLSQSCKDRFNKTQSEKSAEGDDVDVENTAEGDDEDATEDATEEGSDAAPATEGE